MQKRSASLVILLLSVIYVTGQSALPSEKDKFKAGADISDISFIHFEPYQDNSSIKNFNLFKGKLIILDYWATWCGSCISAFPKLERLQKKFPDSLAVFAINLQPDSLVSAFLKKKLQHTKEKINLDFISMRSKLDTLFPFTAIPHYVWIDTEGKSLFVTDGSQLTEENIAKVIRNEPINPKQKIDIKLPWTYEDILFKDGNSGNGSGLIRSSVLSKYIQGIPSGTYVGAASGNRKTVLVTNMDARTLYQLAYTDDSALATMSTELHGNRVRLKVKDSSRYVAFVDNIQNNDHLFTYQLLADNISWLELKQQMKEDLALHFKLKTRWVKAMTRCYVLKAVNKNLLRSKGGNPRIYTDNAFELTIRNMDFSWLHRSLMHNFWQTPFINEAGMQGNIDIHLNVNLIDRASVDKALAQYGLRLEEEDRLLDVLELTEMPINAVYTGQ